MAGSPENPPPYPPGHSESARELFHASAVALGDRALLIMGPSGSGKSGLALELMAQGAELVSDDNTWATVAPESGIWLEAPKRTLGLIEARGMGLLAAEARPRARLALVVDLGQVEAERLPPERTITILETEVPLVHKVESPHFAPALLQYLRGGRVA